MNSKFTIIIILILIFAGINLHAETDTLKHFPGQISFVYPIGTSGAESANYEFGFSINALVGVTGGIRGFECAGIMNTVKNNVLGVQCAGIINTANGYFRGCQAAGIINITNKDFIGCQAAGITNIVNYDFFGVQAAGIANITNKQAKGVQAAGIANIGNGNFTGVKAAGIINITNGVQKGLQVAGIVNKTRKLNGVQIGLINICDTLESGSVPIGLINIVGSGGYHEWELSVADYANTRITYKSGVKDFYTLYTIGANYIKDRLLISGIGCGHIFELSPKFYIQPELMTLSYNNFRMHRHNYSGTTHLKLGFTYNFSNHFGISLAPSIYANVTDLNHENDNDYETSPLKPFKTFTNNHLRVDLGAGLCFAILFR